MTNSFNQKEVTDLNNNELKELAILIADFCLSDKHTNLELASKIGVLIPYVSLSKNPRTIKTVPKAALEQITKFMNIDIDKIFTESLKTNREIISEKVQQAKKIKSEAIKNDHLRSEQKAENKSYVPLPESSASAGKLVEITRSVPVTTQDFSFTINDKSYHYSIIKDSDGLRIIYAELTDNNQIVDNAEHLQALIHLLEFEVDKS